jgi:hypothetical protein
MEIRFRTTEESNKQQKDDFLKLSKAERFYSFLRLMESVNQFPLKNKIDTNKDNFLIVIKSK